MNKSFLAQANQISLRHFLNSFLRDYYNDKRVNCDADSAIISLPQGYLLIKLKSKSHLGAHQYSEEIYLGEKQIHLEELAKLIADNFSDQRICNNFVLKVINSRDNIAMFLEMNQNKKITSYLSSEQLLLKGHPFHPFPKCKWGMDLQDIIKYAPECEGKLSLVWLAIDKSLFTSSIKVTEYKKSIAEFALFDLEEKIDEILVPMHPWQWERVKYKIDQSKVRNIYKGKKTFSALSSMRTLYNKNAPFQLKFSMDIALTNSIRHLSPEESIRGSQIEKIFKTEKIINKIENLKVQLEPFYVVLKGINGRDLIETTVQFRENVFWESSENTILLSSITERMLSGKNRNARRQWFNSFLYNIIKPFLQLQIEYGVLLGAHMQNILIKIKDGLPDKVIFRDCQGTGLSNKGYSIYKNRYSLFDRSNGNILEEEDVNKVFGYYLIVNTVFSTISSLADSSPEKELELLAIFRNFLYALSFENNKDSKRDNSFISFLLNSDYLYQKGNMRCTLNDINENTVKNPWDIYNKIDNPLKKLRIIDNDRTGTVYQSEGQKKQKISFRVIEESDLNRFYSWHHKEFVSEFWELNKSKDELLDYILKVKASPFQLPLILEVNDIAVGYFEAYWAFEDRIAPFCNASVFDRGIHLLIGEEKFLRTQLVCDAIFHITKFLLTDHPLTSKVWGEPRSDNKKIIRIAEKLPGWRVLNEFDFPHKRAMLLECDKTRFFEEQNDYLS